MGLEKSPDRQFYLLPTEMSVRSLKEFIVKRADL